MKVDVWIWFWGVIDYENVCYLGLDRVGGGVGYLNWLGWWNVGGFGLGGGVGCGFGYGWGLSMKFRFKVLIECV